VEQGSRQLLQCPGKVSRHICILLLSLRFVQNWQNKDEKLRVLKPSNMEELQKKNSGTGKSSFHNCFTDTGNLPPYIERRVCVFIDDFAVTW
jgi:hypothetical protein